MKDFGDASSLAPAFTTEIQIWLPNNRILFWPHLPFPPLSLLYCAALHSLRRGKNNIPSVNPEGEIIRGLTQLCNVCSYSRIWLEFTLGHPADSSLPLWTRISESNMYTRHSPVLKPRQRNILTLSKHKDKTHARRSAAACIVFVRRQHKRSNNLCCPPTKGMPRATAAREAYCIGLCTRVCVCDCVLGGGMGEGVYFFWLSCVDSLASNPRSPRGRRALYWGR